MTTTESPIQALLQAYSVELTSKDHKGLAAVADLLPAGTVVSVANLPSDTVDNLIAACAQLARAGLNATPHMVARNTLSLADLDRTLGRLVSEAGVHTCLVLGGDRDHALGPYDSSIQMIETGLFEKHGVRRVVFACHPEGHPRVDDAVLWPALRAKLDAAKARGLETRLVGQFAFEAEPIVAYARRLRAAGIAEPMRVGVAGPAQQATLIKYALICGVGASLRALRERSEFAKNVLTGVTPEALLREVADAQAAEPFLGIDGVHFFTFGSVVKSITLAQELRGEHARQPA